MKDSGKLDLIIFSNGPGEIVTWVKPILKKFLSYRKLTRIYNPMLIFHPCQFASGKEVEVASKLEGIDTVIGSKDYLKLLILGNSFAKRRGWNFQKKGVIISLGGDLIHPVLFRKRIGGYYKLFAYTNNGGWEKYYDKIFVRNDYVKNKLLNRGVDEGKIMVTGDLVYSSIEKRNERRAARSKLGLSDGEVACGFLPGSREFEIKYMLPVFLKVIEQTIKNIDGLKPFILKSPFVTYEMLDDSVKYGSRIKEAEATSGRIVETGNSRVSSIIIKTSAGCEVPLLEGGLEEWGEAFDFAVTVPGTNTIQLAYRGIPALVIAPLNKPELIPVEGVFGLLKWIPLLGRPLLRKIALKYVERFPFSSLPNMYAGYEIFPELFGVIKTEEIIQKLIYILEYKTYKEIKRRLKVFTFPDDPANKIINRIFLDTASNK